MVIVMKILFTIQINDKWKFITPTEKKNETKLYKL
jgi:hypothetical protein